MRQPRKKDGTFGSKLNTPTINKIIKWIGEEVVIDDIIRWLTRDYSISRQTAIRWILKAQTIELKNRT